MRRRRRIARRVLPVFAATALIFVSTAGAGAQETSTSVPGTSVPSTKPAAVGLSLVSQTPWVALHQTFTMKLHIDDPALAGRAGAAIAIRILPSATSRSGFDEVIANRNSERNGSRSAA